MRILEVVGLVVRSVGISAYIPYRFVGVLGDISGHCHAWWGSSVICQEFSWCWGATWVLLGLIALALRYPNLKTPYPAVSVTVHEAMITLMGTYAC